MPDDDRKRRRLGDETKGRIADLAAGWDAPVPDLAGPPDLGPSPGNAPRRKQKTMPPPPPGSLARRQIEDAILDVVDDLEAEEAEESAAAARPRAKPPTTAPPPIPGKRPAGAGMDLAAELDALDDPEAWELPAAAVPPAAKASGKHAHRPSSTRSGPTETGTVDVSGLIPEKTQPPERIIPAPTIDASRAMSVTPPPERSGPLGPLGAGKSGAMPAAAGARPGPPPPPGAKLTGGSAVVPPASPRTTGGAAVVAPPSGATSPSGAVAAAAPRTATGASPTAAAIPPPQQPRAQRAAIVGDDSSMTAAATAPTEADPARSPTQLAVPVGEFDSAHTLLEKDKLRVAYEQATIKRDAASVLLGIAEQPQTIVKETPVEVLLGETAVQLVRDDPTGVEPQTHRFERGDPTSASGSDATEIHAPSAKAVTPKGRLRTIAQLQRRSGVGGDLRYVLTAIFGIRRARRELAELDAKQATRQQSRRRHLTTLGRTAVLAEGFDHPALGPAREKLAGIEEERARHTGQVAAADSELQRVTRDRADKAKQYAADLAAIDAELAGLAKKLEPLEKEVAGVTRRAADLRNKTRRLDEKIAFTEARLSAVNTTPEDRANIQAEIASLKADRKDIQREEPVLAGELDSLHPRIAALEASRADARRRRGELEQAEQDDQRRTEELLAAIGAKRKVVDRAAADAEALRDKILFELGERLYVDRPESMGPELSPIDAIDVELGTGDRRTMELREILQSIDRWKIVRGVALWLLLLGALGGIAFVIVTYVL